MISIFSHVPQFDYTILTFHFNEIDKTNKQTHTQKTETIWNLALAFMFTNIPCEDIARENLILCDWTLCIVNENILNQQFNINIKSQQERMCSCNWFTSELVLCHKSKKYSLANYSNTFKSCLCISICLHLPAWMVR